MIKHLTILSLLTSTLCFGQYEVDSLAEEEPDTSSVNWMDIKKRTYIGGELSLSFGNQIYLYIAPLAGYEFYKGLSAGVQASYQLRRVNFAGGGSISSHMYGGGVFMRYRPDFFPYLLAQTEFSAFNVENLETLQNNDRTTIPAFMAGLGYAGGFKKAYYHLLVMYDFIDNPNMALPRFFGDIPIYIRYGMVFYLG